MYPQSRHPAPHQPGQPFKFTVAESCDRIKEEFSFLQAQYHSLKMECEKLAQEKTEMQRHYVMYYEMSYGLNVEMHKQTEIAKRLNAICAQIIPFLSQEHQQQVAAAVERAKQVTMTELNAIIGQSAFPHFSGAGQAGLQHPLPHAHAPPVPMPPHPASLPPGSMSGGPGSGLLQLSNAMMGNSGPHMSSVKDEKDRDRERDRERESRNSVSPSDRDRASVDKHISKYSEQGEPSRKQNNSTPNNKRKRDEKDSGDSDGDKSDDNLVVDVSNEDPPSPRPNGEQSSPRENNTDKHRPKKERPNSPNSIASSASTPNSKHKEGLPNDNKPSTSPVAKSETPTSGGAVTPGSSSSVMGIKPPVGKVPPIGGPGGYPFMPGQVPGHADLPNPYVAAGLHNNISPGSYRGPMGWPVSQEESRKLSSQSLLHHHHAAAAVQAGRLPPHHRHLPMGPAGTAPGQGCLMQ